MKLHLAPVLGLIVWAGSASAASSTVSPSDILDGVAEAASTGNLKAAEQLFVRSPTIMDDFTPFAWQGLGAVASWWKDFGSYTQQAGLTNVSVTLLPALVSDVTGDRAYLVVPGVISGSLNGKPFRMTGRNTAVLDHTPAGWRIASWTWSDDTR